VVLMALVVDRVGTLARMLQLCTRKGWNVESCTVSVTEESDVKRITLFLDCQEDPDRMAREFLALTDILEARALRAGEHVDRELLLAKVRVGADGALPAALVAVGARIVWREGDLVIAEATGSHEVLNPIVVEPPAGVVEAAVTGRTCLEAGPDHIALPPELEAERVHGASAWPQAPTPTGGAWR
jgi:acetolactate synthase-1/3 small subunit